MKKLISVIPITMLILLLSLSVKVSAANVKSYPYYGLCRVPNTPTQNVYYVIGYNESPVYFTSYNNVWVSRSLQAYVSYDLAVQAINNNVDLSQSLGIYKSSIDNGDQVVISFNGSFYYSSPNIFATPEDYENYINPPTPTPSPTPIPNMWDKFYEWYYNLYGYYPADDSLFGYFRSLFEEYSDSSASGGPSQHSISTHRPAPTPTPTPIPYSVSVVPVYDNNGNITNYIYNYTYTSESGDTIVATSPPEQSNYNNTNEEPYNPDPLTVPTSSLDAWYMFAYDENEHPNPELQNPNDDFGTGMKYIEDNIDGYDRPIDYIMSVINAFPDDWLMLFGIGIGLIFIAGIISRFLS